MNKISCEMCMDLIPLVRDGVASEDSCRAVEAHVAACAGCRALLSGETPAPAEAKPVVARVQRKLRCLFLLLAIWGIFFGVSLNQLSGNFCIVFFTPLLGALAYGVYRWKALWIVPVVLATTVALSQILLFLRDSEMLYAMGVLLLEAGTLIFSEAGVLIVGLLHFGFRKEKENEEA